MSELELHEQLERKIPYAPLALAVMPSAESLGRKINDYLVSFRHSAHNISALDPAFKEYSRDTYLMNLECIRYGTGEGKAILKDSARGKDVFILTDVMNYSLTYRLNGFTNFMSPDDHFQDIKRVISALNGKAKRVNVIMPFLYEGRQHNRTNRESMDGALMFKELVDMGVSNFITFDAHDPRIQNIAPLVNFDNYNPPYQFLRTIMKSYPDLIIDKERMIVISPDEGALDRAVYFANVIGVNTGMFYKRRDYSVIVGGKNPIVAHEFLGSDLRGKDAIIIDDMISSGGSILDTARQLKSRGAHRVFMCTTFGLFTDGLDAFDKAYEHGDFDKVITTNLTYQPAELFEREWFASADMTKYMANIIDFLNHETSITAFSTSTDKIHSLLDKFNAGQQTESDVRIFEATEF